MGIKVLFVTSYPLEYNSSANIRNWGLLEGMYANGYEIYTLSPYPTDRTMFNGELANDCFKKRYWIGDVPTNPTQNNEKLFIKESPFKGRFKKFVFDLFNYFSVYDRRSFLKKKIKASSIDESFDVIVSSSDPKSAHLFARELLRQQSSIAKRWIQYWGDPFSNDISSKRFLGNLLVTRAERGLIKQADKVVYVSPFTANSLKEIYQSYKEKISFLPIPYRLSNNKGANHNYEKGLVGYFGDFSSKNRNILPFYDALKELGYNANIIGNSDITLAPTDRIRIGSRVPVQELSTITDKTHIFVCVCNLHGTQIPGKVYHYVNSGKPIVIILDGEMEKELRDYFESFHRFYLCSNSIDSIETCLKNVMNEKKEFIVPDSLNPQIIAKKFIE